MLDREFVHLLPIFLEKDKLKQQSFNAMPVYLNFFNFLAACNNRPVSRLDFEQEVSINMLNLKKRNVNCNQQDFF